MKAILVGVCLKKDPNFKNDLLELESLAQALDLEIVGTLIQNLEKINKSFYIGKGKVTSLKELIEEQAADLVIFDNELSMVQISNLEKELMIEVVDRTSLILKIFELRAKTKEARLQVEIAKLKYLLPRLIGLDQALYSQQGGSNFRGIGEKKLELDRRRIKQTINSYEQQLKDMVKKRKIQRAKRLKSSEKIVCLVGYTNSGKSTIMNKMLEYSDKNAKKVLEKDMLFATLETATRKIISSDNKNFLLTDTVGFINKLPTHLVKAFRSTLEEVKEADLLVQVIDSSNLEYQKQLEVTNEVLKQLKADQIPMIYVYNKRDKSKQIISMEKDSLLFSAKEDDIEILIDFIKKNLKVDHSIVSLYIPFEKAQIFSYLKANANILDYQENDQGYEVTAELSFKDQIKYQDQIKKAIDR